MKTAQLTRILLLPSLLALSLAAGAATAKAPVAAAKASGELSSLPVNSPDQQQLRQALQASDYKSALGLWAKAYPSGAWSDSATGYALYSYLIFKSGAELTGVEHLFLLKNPTAIASDVRHLWQEAAPPTHSVWKLVRIRWSPEWTRVFAGFSGLENSPLRPATLTSKDQLRGLEQQVARLASGSNERASAQWQLALWAAIFNETKLAKAQLESLLNSKQTIFDADQLHMAKARILFQESDLKAALAEYLTIRKTSDYWLETLEERAWTYMRLGQPEKTLGELRTLLSPVFTPQVGPEPYFLQAFVNLKICDFSQIFKTLEDFKTRYRPHVVSMQALAANGTTPQAEQAISQLDHTALAWNSVGVNSTALPRYFHRDDVVANEMGIRQGLIHDRELLTSVQQKYPGAFSISTLGARNINTLLQRSESRAGEARVRVFKRLQVLAENEVKEISSIIQKMHIIEAEAIERMHLVQKEQLAKGNGSTTTIAHSGDELVFPVNANDKELWIDELDKYQYQIKGCPSKGRKTL